MNSTDFPQRLLDLIDEDDRLLALAAMADVRLEEDPGTGQWVCAIRPSERYPLPFDPVTHYGVDVAELDNLIRRVWGTIAQQAISVGKATIDEGFDTLAETLPVGGDLLPRVQDWIPTDDPDRFESPRSYLTWRIDGVKIIPMRVYIQLEYTPSGYCLSTPLGQSREYSLHTPGLLKPVPPPGREPGPLPDAGGSDDVIALPAETVAQIQALERQTLRYAILDGITASSGVIAFLFWGVASFMLIPFVGPVIFLVLVYWFYHRDDPIGSVKRLFNR